MVSAMLVIFAAQAHAQNVIMGAGVASCGTWTADQRAPKASNRSIQGEQWVLGFLSSAAMSYDIDPLKDVDADGVWAWFDNYCQANPLTSITQAAVAFLHEVKVRRQQQRQ